MGETENAGPRGGPAIILKFEPKFMDSLDARIIQYKYALVKLERLIQAIDKILDENGTSNNIILVHYLIYLASNLFAINETGFFPKLEALENFKATKKTVVPISQVVTHIPYDMKDQAIIPLETLPSVSSSILSLKAFRALCIVCQEGYQKRFDNASKEIGNNEFLEDLESLFTKSFINIEEDYDLIFASPLLKFSSLVFPFDTQMSDMADYSEASLIDIDISSLITITFEITKMLNAQKPMINKYKAIKQAPKNVQDKQLKETTQSGYALHRVFFWALRINELYFILRRYGRQIFISNHDHLYDQKFCSFVSNGMRYREMLKYINEHFFESKKNGVLIATITRFLRLDTKHEISSKMVFDFVGFIFQSVTYLEDLLKMLREFSATWIAAELSFRNSHNLPVDNLLQVNDVVEAEKVKDLKAKRLRTQLLAKEKARQNTASNIQSAGSKKAVQVARAASKVQVAPGSPSGSIESTNSVPRSVSRSTSRSMVEPQSPFYLHRQTSASSLQSSTSASSSIEKKAESSPIPMGRRRSSSQPISFNAAATALKANGNSTPTKKEQTIRSPSGSLRRAGSVTKKPALQQAISPSNNKHTMDAVDENSEVSPSKVEVRKTASQKFQQHLLEASRSGALYSKEKEVFSNVVFDPNNPSATNIKRQAKVASKEISPTEEKMVAPFKSRAAPAPVVSDQKPTRAQITKSNTRRNSVVVQSDSFSRLSDPSRHSLISSSSQTSSAVESLIVKKVRFTGVPEYDPVEDAPTSQTNRILKGFAALKLPARKSATVKRKDEAFKQEESSLFKQHLSDENAATYQIPSGIYAPGSQITSKFSRFKSRF